MTQFHKEIKFNEFGNIWQEESDFTKISIVNLQQKYKHKILSFLTFWTFFRCKPTLKFWRKKFPIPGVEPGPARWKRAILAVRPYGIRYKLNTNNQANSQGA